MWKRHPCRWTAAVELSGRDAASTLLNLRSLRLREKQSILRLFSSRKSLKLYTAETKQ
jgi:hypothetical protein